MVDREYSTREIYGFVNSVDSYEEHIPALISLLESGVGDRSRKEGVIRALGAKEARKTRAGEVLIEEYWRTPSSELEIGWAIGNSIDILMEDKFYLDIKKLSRIPKTVSPDKCLS